MNTLRLPLLAVFAALSLLVSLARADEAAYARILKERDAILSQIVAHRESMFAGGTIDDEALLAARLALWAFRRDTATSKGGKVAQQELIVGIYEKKLSVIRSRDAAGLEGPEALLFATDALLQAEQTLEELRKDTKQG